MRKDDLIRVRHMLEAAGEAVLFARTAETGKNQPAGRFGKT